MLIIAMESYLSTSHQCPHSSENLQPNSTNAAPAFGTKSMTAPMLSIQERNEFNMGQGCSPVVSASGPVCCLLMQVQFLGAARINFQHTLFSVFTQSLCAVSCTSICAQVNDPKHWLPTADWDFYHWLSKCCWSLLYSEQTHCAHKWFYMND